MKDLVGILALLVPVAWAVAGPAYPLKLSPGQHYVVDQNGTPFFIQGDSPWYLTESLSQSNADYYLSNRWVQGFNSIILDITATTAESQQPSQANQYGQFPFTIIIAGHYTNLLSWNTNYFTNVDWVIQRAGYYGICVFAYPLYDGFGGSDWYLQMANNTTNVLFAYGQFIGNRYKNFTNIVWLGAGDYSEPYTGTNCLWDWVAAGIKSADTNHLFSAQAQRPTPANYYTNFVNFNSSYPQYLTYLVVPNNYTRTPAMPSFMREAYYEYAEAYGGNFTGLQCRQEAYWSIFSGDMGHFYGDEHQWPFNTGWQAEMWDASVTAITNVAKLMNSRLWYNFVPDTNHTVVTSGYGTSGNINYITTTREASGKTIMAYIPAAQMTPTVAMTNISGTTANAWWYNPTNGIATIIGSYSTTGTRTFTPPDTNDWVLVLDDASQKYPPPGMPGKVSLGFQALGGDIYKLTVTGIPGQAFALQYTTSLNASWQAVGSGTLDSSGAISYYVIAMSSATFFRALNQ